MEEEDGESDLNTSEIDWGEEENHSWSGGGESDYNSWEGETDSEISMEEEEFAEETGSEKEPEPPDLYQHEINSIDWSREEADQRDNHEGELYQEETGSEISLEGHNQHEEEIHGVETEDCLNEEAEAEEVYQEDGFDYDSEHEESYIEERPWCETPYSDQEDDHQGETDAQVSLDYSEVRYGDEPESHQDYSKENEVLSEAGRDDDDEYEPRYITFSGYNQGAEDYFRWEKDMEDWFQANNIPEKEKTMYAEETLTKNAYRHWAQDTSLRLEFGLPEYSWEEMKRFIHKELVEDAEINQESEDENYAEPDRLIMAVRSTSRVKPKEPKAVNKKIYKQEKISHQGSLQALKVQGKCPGAKKFLQVPKKKTSKDRSLESNPLKLQLKLQSVKPHKDDQQQPNQSFDPGIRQEDEQPNNAERLKESHGKHLTCPQNVEEVSRTIQSTHAAKEQIILQLSETIWEQKQVITWMNNTRRLQGVYMTKENKKLSPATS
ncbi:uncharacterized protein LOC130506448 [Raphanus sativus]|uniref:Uncharacterized protein LOC130506448 n=1 Tax=Raphanus sativus TaxID=3726 RepID=A0A9W3D031_RAPSA|nr:uncharacterized protein LOC130506448 [Raphanus sativus]